MKAHRSWHATKFGRVALFLGGLRLAVPVMILVAIAMIWGTYLYSQPDLGAKVAMRVVYGSAWFIALMALVCVSLIFAVVTRYPWQRRHVGFIVVHASLIVLIIAGFWSLFGRIEGQIRLQEGQHSNVLEMDEQRLELVDMSSGEPVVVAAVDAETSNGTVKLGDVTVEIAGRWSNIQEERYVADDGPEPLRAIEMIPAPGMPQSIWIGQSSKSGGPAVIGGMTIRVLGEGESWEPPESTSDDRGKYFFVLEGERYELGEVGDEAFPGWRIEKIQRFRSATVSASGLSESEEGGDNPAINVVITDGKGTVERHTAFEKFPDMVLPGKRIQGDALSGARLIAGSTIGETLVIHPMVPGDPTVRMTYLAPDGRIEQLEHEGLPWSFQVGSHQMTLVSQVSRARMATRYIQAPPAESFRRALLVKLAGDASEPTPLPWKASLPLMQAQRNLALRYGPRIERVPFTIHLNDFRKVDYPGTDMAMAYESDVTVHIDGQPDQELTIFMNNPYVHGPWKVYQSGFLGDDISIFSVMKDPGLTLTYIACTTLCIGILITFYSRALSSGHPGIAMPFAKKEWDNVAAASVDRAVDGLDASGTGSVGQPGVDGHLGSDSDPAQGSGDAPGHVRAPVGGGVDR